MSLCEHISVAKNVILADASQYQYCYGYSRSRSFVTATVRYVHYCIDKIICSRFGHKWEVVDNQPESGGETIVCTRCGELHQLWFNY